MEHLSNRLDPSWGSRVSCSCPNGCLLNNFFSLCSSLGESVPFTISFVVSPLIFAFHFSCLLLFHRLPFADWLMEIDK